MLPACFLTHAIDIDNDFWICTIKAYEGSPEWHNGEGAQINWEGLRQEPV